MSIIAYGITTVWTDCRQLACHPRCLTRIAGCSLSVRFVAERVGLVLTCCRHYFVSFAAEGLAGNCTAFALEILAGNCIAFAAENLAGNCIAFATEHLTGSYIAFATEHLAGNCIAFALDLRPAGLAAAWRCC